MRNSLGIIKIYNERSLLHQMVKVERGMTESADKAFFGREVALLSEVDTTDKELFGKRSTLETEVLDMTDLEEGSIYIQGCFRI